MNSSVTYPWYEYVKKTENVHNSYIDNIGILKHETLRNWFRNETFYYLWVWRFLDMSRERHKLSMLIFTSASHHARHPPQVLGELRKSTVFFRDRKSTVWLFSNPQNPPHTLLVHNVIHIPGLISYLGFLFWHFWMTHPPRACVNTCAHVAPN